MSAKESIMKNSGFLKRFGMILLHTFWLGLALVAIGMIGVPAVIVELAPREVTAWLLETPLGTLTLSAAVYAIALLVLLSPMIFKKEKLVVILEKLGLKNPPRVQMFLWALMMQGIMIAITMVVLVVLTMVNIPGLDLTQEQELPFSQLFGWYEYVSAFLLLVVLAPIFEELMFRGYFYGRLRKYSGVVASALITSVAFSVVHGQVNVAIVVGVLSVFMCLLREKFDSIYPTIAMHMLQNGFSYVMLFILPLYAKSLF